MIFLLANRNGSLKSHSHRDGPEDGSVDPPGQIRYAEGMSDLAYFEYATVIRPQGNQLEGTPAHYLVEVAINNPVNGKKSVEGVLQKIVHHFLKLAFGLDVQEITDFAAISESEAQKLKKISPAGTHHDGSVFLVE